MPTLEQMTSDREFAYVLGEFVGQLRKDNLIDAQTVDRIEKGIADCINTLTGTRGSYLQDEALFLSFGQGIADALEGEE